MIQKIEKSINKKTKAIVPVSYHGLPCDLDEIIKIGKYNIPIIGDNAQTMLGEYKNGLLEQELSFQCSLRELNIISSHEGGVLLTNNSKLAEKARKLEEGDLNLSMIKVKWQPLYP